MKDPKDLARQAPEEDGAEEEAIASLRPKGFAEYIGQPELVEQLDIAVKAARLRDEPLDHVLLHGPPGLGKTTLAHIIAREMGTEITMTSGPALERGADLMGILTHLSTADVLFIDEIHRMPRVVEEFLYPAMEDFQVDFIFDKGINARTLRYSLKRFTLVGATTRAGLISSPLRDRFGMQYHLDFYAEESLARIVRRSAAILEVEVDEEGAGEIARRSRGTPRVANRLLRRVRDYAQVKADGVVTREVAREALRREGIDERGLDRLDRRFLAAIVENYKGKPVGIEAIAATINEEVNTLTDLVEPYLLKIGFLIRTPGGRQSTEAALVHLGYDAPHGQKRLL